MNFIDLLISLMIGSSIITFLFYANLFNKVLIFNILVLLLIIFYPMNKGNQSLEVLLAILSIEIFNLCSYYIRVKIKKL